MKRDWPEYGTTCGIYAIENTASKKVYIGQAQDVRKRWNEHLRTLRLGNHGNSHLQRSWNKHGEASFRFVLLEECDVCDLDAREQAWIDTLEAVKEGYNISPTASTTRGYRHTDEAKATMSHCSKMAWEDPEFRDRMAKIRSTPEHFECKSASLKKTFSAPEIRDALSDRTRKGWADPEEGERRRAATRRGKQTPEARAHQSGLTKGRWENPAYGERVASAIKATTRAKSKLTEEKVAEIRRRHVRLCPVNGRAALAQEFDVSPALISAIVAGRIWK